MTNVPTMDLDALNKRFTNARVRLASLQGQARELNTQRAKLVSSIGLAKARIDLAPEATEVFNYLQERAHEHAVGEFETLLSAFVGDVIPEAGTIQLELGTERGAPALHIRLNNGGDLEEIMDGNGGGLTNVVITALAFSALSRTRNRQLMLLDEPDCWLKAMYIPAFTRVIAEVANPQEKADGTRTSGVQTLMISHNDVDLMDEGAHLQDLRMDYDLAQFAKRLGVSVVHVGDKTDSAYVVYVADKSGNKKRDRIEVRYRTDGDAEKDALDKGFPYIQSISGARPWADAQEVGVRWVEVVNLRRHVFTHLDLSPGLNVQTGDINGGKSTLYFTAFRAMAYGESDDGMIRHGADAATIRMGLEDNIVVEMVRARKGTPKVLYRLYKDGNLLHEARQEHRSDVPDFIANALRISRVDDLDIQLRNQKQPIFLLNETPARRAQLLSVGKESGLLQELIEKHRVSLRRDRESVKREEVELNQINRTLTLLQPVANLGALVDIMDSLLDEAKVAESTAEKVQKLVERMSPLAHKVDLHSVVGSALVMNIEVPTIVDTQPLAKLITTLSTTVHASKFSAVPEVPTAPHIVDTSVLQGLIQRLTNGQHAAAALVSMPVVPVVPAVVDTEPLIALGKALSNSQKTIESLTKEETEGKAAFAAAEVSLHDLKHKMGVCPTCAQAFKKD